MQLVDITIIYVALGAPLGVYYTASRWTEGPIPAAAVGVLNAFLWPIALLFSKPSLRRISGSEETLESRILAAAQVMMDSRKLADLSFALERYAELSEALALPVGTSAVDGRYEAGLQSGSQTAAWSAVRRTNERKIRSAQEAAANDLISLVSAGGPETLELCAQLARRVGDHKTAEHLASLARIDSQIDRVAIAA